MTLFLTSFFQSSLNNRHLFGASCLSRCLIYKVHTAANSSRRVLMITHRFRFVKNFFQVFSNFLKLFHSPRFRGHLAPASQPTRLGYHTQAALSRTFFKFSKLLSSSQTRNPLGRLRSRPVLPCRRALAYISKTAPLCQHLFSLFSRFFSTFFSTTTS